MIGKDIWLKTCSLVVAFVASAGAAAAQNTISGQIRQHVTNAPISNVTVDLQGATPQSTQTDADGQYSFANVAPGDWSVVPTKAHDIAGSITSLDASRELQGAVGIFTPTANDILACDANASGFLSAIDASLILQYRVGLIGDLPNWTGCGTEWQFVPQPTSIVGRTSTLPQPMPAPTPCIRGSITYTGLAADQTSQDFLAILNGDCSGDWPAMLSPTPTSTATITATPTQTGTTTDTPSVTPTATITNTPPPTATRTGSSTPTMTATRTSTITQTPTRTGTGTRTGTITQTPTITPLFGLPWPVIGFGTTYTGIGSPVYVANADNGDAVTRTFLVQQSGIIRLVRNGVLQATSFLDIGSSGGNRIAFGGEQGLLSVAFPPSYASKRYFYVNYTRAGDGATVVARYKLLTGNNDQADVNSEQIVLTIAQPFPNHNGGQLQFGVDGFLYIGMGDGGSGGDPGNRAQDTTVLLGKILRIDTESVAAAATPTYAIPNNPTPNATVTATPGYRREIWATGVRNPWRFSFDRATNDLYIGDVGQDTVEEIDFQLATSTGGENYGWRLFEGNSQFNCPAPCSSAGLTPPVIEYTHISSNCAVTGGYVYRGSAYPCMYGTYIYADYCSGRIWGARHIGTTWQNVELAQPGFNITGFGEDAAGNLYLCDATNGQVRLITDSCVAPTATPTSTPTVTPTQTP